MRLESVHLKNFRSYKNSEYTFGPGLTAIVGPNGSGKTTLLEGFVWALYGTAAARGSADSIIPADESGSPSVVATFFLSDTTWTVERTLKVASIANVGGEVASTLKGVTEYVEGLLGMTRDEFYACIMANQKDLAWLQGKSGPDRHRFVSKILGYDIIKDAQKTAREKKRDALAMQRLHEPDVTDPVVTEEDLEEALVAVDLADEEVRLNEVTLKATADSLDKLTGALATQRKEWEEWKGFESVLMQAEATCVTGVGALETCQGDIAALPEPQDPEALEAAVQELKDSVSEYESHIAESTSQLGGLSANRAQEKDALQKLTKHRELIVGLGPGSECSTCGQVMDGDVFDVHLADLSQQQQQHTLKITILDEQHAQEVVWETGFIASLRQHQRNLDTALEEVREAETNATKRTDLETIEVGLVQRVADNTSARDIAIADLDKNSYDPNAFNDLMKQNETLNATLQKSVADADTLNAAASTLRSVFDHLNNVRRRQIEDEAIARKEQEAAALYGAVDSVFAELTKSLNEAARPLLSAIATEIVSETTGGRFDALTLDESYTPQLYADGVCLPVPSGGEEDIISLALRIAVGQLMASKSGTPIGMLIMDEPFGSLDDERQRLVMDMLSKLCETRFEQIIVITHEMGIRDGADHIIELGLS